MYSALGDAALPASGFPIRVSTGQRLFSASPWLIAAVHALRRLLVPRHPPCALTILTVILAQHRPYPSYCFRSTGGALAVARLGDTRFSPPPYRWPLTL